MAWEKWRLDRNFKGKVKGEVSRFSTQKSFITWEGIGFSNEKCK